MLLNSSSRWTPSKMGLLQSKLQEQTAFKVRETILTNTFLFALSINSRHLKFKTNKCMKSLHYLIIMTWTWCSSPARTGSPLHPNITNTLDSLLYLNRIRWILPGQTLSISLKHKDHQLAKLCNNPRCMVDSLHMASLPTLNMACLITLSKTIIIRDLTTSSILIHNLGDSIQARWCIRIRWLLISTLLGISHHTSNHFNSLPHQCSLLILLLQWKKRSMLKRSKQRMRMLKWYKLLYSKSKNWKIKFNRKSSSLLLRYNPKLL